jgi:hypothetical protein
MPRPRDRQSATGLLPRMEARTRKDGQITYSKVFLNLSHAPSKEAKKITRIAEKESKRVRDMRKPSKGTVVTYIA